MFGTFNGERLVECILCLKKTSFLTGPSSLCIVSRREFPCTNVGQGSHETNDFAADRRDEFVCGFQGTSHRIVPILIGLKHIVETRQESLNPLTTLVDIQKKI